MSIERQAVSALKWSTISKVVGQSVAWAVTLLVIRLLSPDDYGLMAISAVIISIVASIAELGLGASIVQSQVISKDELAKVAGALLVLNLGLGMLVGLGAPLTDVLFDDPRLIDVVRVSALHFLFNAVATVPQSLAYREMRFKWLAFIDLTTSLLASLSTLALAWWGAGVWALVFGSLAGAACRTTLLLARGGAVRPTLGLQGIGHHLRFGGKMTVARMAWQLVYQSDVLIAGRFFTKEAVGIYSVSLHLATLPMQKAMSILNQVAFPTVARMQDELPRLRARLLDASRLLSFVAVPALWGISAVSPEFVTLALGERWLGAIFPLQVVTLVVPLRMLSTVFGASVSALGRADVDLRNMLVSSAVLPIAFLAGAQWGVEGLALSWVVAVPLMFWVNFPRTSRVLGIKLREVGASIYGSIAAGIVMYGAVWGARLALSSAPELYRLVALIAVGAATYLAAAALLDRQIWVDVKRMTAALRS
jgi:O-antigen/teichoic acid export membrane protein